MTPPRGRGRPGYDADTVVELATRVFTERGYHGTSMDDLATALGRSRSAIYHHVSGKQEILARALDKALAGLEAVLDEAGSVDEVVRGSVRVLVAELPSVTLLLRVRGNSEVERAALARRREIDARFANVVIRAQRDGVLRADLDASLVARLIFGTVNSLVEWYRPDAPRHTDADAGHLADAICTMIFDGLRVP